MSDVLVVIERATKPSCRTPEPGWMVQCRMPDCPGFWRTGLASVRAAIDAFEIHWDGFHAAYGELVEIADALAVMRRAE